MRILIIGAGGIGGYYGAKLAIAKNDIHFLARGKNLEALQKNGLSLIDTQGDLHVSPIGASATPPTDWEPDLCIFSVKNYDLEKACAMCAEKLQRRTILLTLQNGVSAYKTVRNIFAKNPILTGLTYANLELAAPGIVRKIGRRAEIRFGSNDIDRTTQQGIEEIMLNADIDVNISEDIDLDIWKKFTFIAAISGVTSALRETIGVIRETPQHWKFLCEAVNEAVMVARTQLPNIPNDLYVNHIQEMGRLPHSSASSMLTDLLANKPLELPWLSGEIVRLGIQANIPTPTHLKITQILQV